MKFYKTKPQYVEAVEIDHSMYNHLISEGYIGIDIGDFLIKMKNGQETIWPRKGFLATYEDVEV